MTTQKTAKPAKHTPAKGGKADETAPATPDVTVADAPLDAEVTYTLPDLLARSGSATLDEAEAYLEGLTETDLAEEGAAVATPRLEGLRSALSQGLRLLGDRDGRAERALAHRLERAPPCVHLVRVPGRREVRRSRSAGGRRGGDASGERRGGRRAARASPRRA